MRRFLLQLVTYSRNTVNMAVAAENANRAKECCT
jgi:hypothetical protein